MSEAKRILRFVLALALILGLAGPSILASAAQAQQRDFSRIDAYVTEQMDASRIPGVAIAVVERGHLVHSEGFGEAGDGRDVTPQTLFPIGSLTKSMTALAIMQLVEAGDVDLDQPVQTYLPWFQVADPEASSRITVRHLLNQVSGISRQAGIELVVEHSEADLEETVRSLRSTDLNRPVGASYEYSNANFAILSLVVQVIAGQPFSAYLEEHIFAPLGMESATTSLGEARDRGLTDVHRYWFGQPVATPLTELPGHEPAFVSVEDMAAYATMYLNHGILNGTRVLSADGINQLVTPATNEATRSLLGMEFSFRYGMGWFVGPFGAVDEAIWHLGELPSFNAWLVMVPQHDRAVIVLTNADSQLPWPGANAVMSRIPIGIVNLLAGETPPAGVSLARFYLIFDLAVLAVVAVQVGALLRLLRQPLTITVPSPGLKHHLTVAARLGPLLWEVGLGVAIVLGVPLITGMSWQGNFLSAPDLTLVLLLVAALWLVTAIARTIRIVQALRPAQPHSAELVRDMPHAIGTPATPRLQ